MARPLDSGEKHFLRLIAKGEEKNGGWAKVSAVIYPLVQRMPSELVEHEPTDDGWGRARLTNQGRSVLECMNSWLGGSHA